MRVKSNLKRREIGKKLAAGSDLGDVGMGVKGKYWCSIVDLIGLCRWVDESVDGTMGLKSDEAF